ncbi:aminotransferase-like domain-containing protein [Desulfogranum japonicum]|uniref:aminotransferase-like domain-containing protein n=1 Tax=Desulfogranum japonicum TaxID=231447 RepID=UPI001969B10A|nr:PLP-dependent aminotransferase family protein [Desulfogranum japonicum]
MRIKTDTLYREVADKVAGLIAQGTFRAGDKVPSIRQMSRQMKVSINTIKVAYGLLEDACIIEAKPQSGYYVRPKLPAIPEEPDLNPPKPVSLQLTSTELVIRLMQDILDPEKVQFGAAIPAPDLIPEQKLSRILSSVNRRHGKESVAYAIPPGNKKLRVQIARRMLRAGCSINPGEIIITNGAAEAVFLALRTICRPGDTVAVGSPIYFNFIQMLKELGLNIVEIASSPSTGLHLKSLKLALQQTDIQACLVISNFNNPFGISISDDKKEQLVKLLARYRVPLIEDDINGNLSFGDDRPTVARSWDKYGDVLLCSSFSKTIAPGYRVGWIAPGRHYEGVLHQKLITNIASASPTQLAVADFLESGGYDHHLRHIRREYAAKIGSMSEAIGHYFPKGTRVTRPQGGFALWVEMPRAVDGMQLYKEAWKNGITIAPGTVFSTTDDFRNCLRLNGAFWSEKNKWAIEALGQKATELATKSQHL